MKFSEKMQWLNKKSDAYQELNEIGEKLPSNKEIASSILEALGNSTTQCVEDKDIKSSYYVHLKDTIYLSNHKNCGQDYTRICLVAHECIHSIQAKWLQMLNFILSNIELIAFVIFAILMCFSIAKTVCFGLYVAIVILSCIPRVVLESDAIRRSIPTSKQYLNSRISEYETGKLVAAYAFQNKILMPLFYGNLFVGKLFRIAILMAILFFR